jgi:tetratricopeptide (TPR) repeat protein
MGIALYHLNKNDEAIDSFTKSIHLNSNFYESFNNIGNCFQKKNQLHNAVNNFKKSIDINPNFFQGYYNLANCYKRLNEFDLSEKNYLNSIKLSPNNIDAYYNLGNLYSLEKKHTDSIRCFESILKIDGNHNLSLSQKIHQQLHIGEWSLGK